MLLEQPRPYFLPSSRQLTIILATKDTATVFQRHYALPDIMRSPTKERYGQIQGN